MNAGIQIWMLAFKLGYLIISNGSKGMEVNSIKKEQILLNRIFEVNTLYGSVGRDPEHNGLIAFYVPCLQMQAR